MLLLVFSSLPTSLQLHVADYVRAEAGTNTESVKGDVNWIELLKAVDPVLCWSPASNSLELLQDGWQRLVQYATSGCAALSLSGSEASAT